MLQPKKLAALTIALVISIPGTLFAQGGVSSMSMGAARSGMASYAANGRYIMPSPDMIRIEELINYHRHELPMPSDGLKVRLSVGQERLESGKTVLQFGLTTPRALDPDLVPPLNLVLVIDQSGSMSGERITCVKAAIHAFVDRLRKQDKVCIVGFNHEAKVVLPATGKTKVKKIKRAIDSMVAGGSTNLHGGLILGYQQATACYDPERTNRVILLSDGITNTGVVNLKQIARESKEFNLEGIDLSTIGLGQNLNQELLRHLADAGRGLIHFVGDAKDIEKTFVTEIDSLLAPAARKVTLSIDFGEYSERAKIYGYQPNRLGTAFEFELDDLNHGATQVIMARLPKRAIDLAGISATLRYTDAITRKQIKTRATFGGDKADGISTDSVRKNYAIALVAKSIRKAAVESNDGHCSEAEKRLKKGIRSARKACEAQSDVDLERVVDIAKEYRDQIRTSIARRNSRD